ncbi:MAG: MerR family transcriptional regulator [Dehalococcoidia bacterium]|nr:MAG: MerR family transcriptional regulator [Dehalococcoidia bacterium]
MNDMQEIQRRINEAHDKGDTAEVHRLVDELKPFYTDMLQDMSRQVKEAASRIEKQPNLARCVASVVEEFEAIGIGNRKDNSSYALATQASTAYEQMEEARVRHVSAKKIYEEASDRYEVTTLDLTVNLILRHLEPTREGMDNPLKWFLPASQIIELARDGLDLNITLPTLRKYQALGLVPAPIRLGRRGHYSMTTLLRLTLIKRYQAEGRTLADMKKVLDKELAIMVYKVAERIRSGSTAPNLVGYAMSAILCLADPASEHIVNIWNELNKDKQWDICEALS